jgi:hypothetical protein
MKYTDADKENYLNSTSSYKSFLDNKTALSKITDKNYENLENLSIEDQESIKTQLKSKKIYHWIAK